MLLPIGCGFLRPVVEGLEYLHFHQIVHRDMSLANLLLTRENDVVSYSLSLISNLTSFNLIFSLFQFVIDLVENLRFWTGDIHEAG